MTSMTGEELAVGVLHINAYNIAVHKTTHYTLRVMSEPVKMYP